MNDVNRMTRRPTRPRADLAPPGWGEPAWEVSYLFPAQGAWSVEEYLSLPTNHLVEFANGRLEVLPMPTDLHQAVVIFLIEVLLAFVKPRRAGTVRTAPLPVELWEDKYREPDVLFMLAKNAHRIRAHWRGADLAMEVLCNDSKDRKRDLVIKRKEYAKAGIQEYWIVDPRNHKITVLTLRGSAYRVHGEFTKGMRAASVLLPGFSVSVDEVFAQGK